MQRLIVAVVLAALLAGLVGCGGGDAVKQTPQVLANPYVQEAVEPDPGATVHRFTHIMIKPPQSDLEYGMGIANKQGEIPYGEWYYWTHSPDVGYVYNTVPFGEYHIPTGAIEVGFVATYGLIDKNDPMTEMTVVFFAEENHTVNPQVDWSWTFKVDPSLPTE